MCRDEEDAKLAKEVAALEVAEKVEEEKDDGAAKKT